MRVGSGVTLVAITALLAGSGAAWGQAPAARSAQQPGRYERTSGSNNPALQFYGGVRQASYLQPPAVERPAPVPVHTARPGKPFQGVYQSPTITPYLALDARESEEGLPNYFLLVKPQLEQHRINMAHHAENRRVQQQLRRSNLGGAAASPNGGIPTTGHSPQFMNIGGYYPGLR